MTAARGALAALALLTRVPVPRHPAPGPGAVGWFGPVGLLLGSSAALPAWLALRWGWRGQASMIAAVLVVAWWAWGTRMLHWDGLADAADAAWGAADPASRLAVMADTRTGAFGATAVALVALGQASAIGASLTAGRVWPLVLAPVLGRSAASLLVWGLRPARSGGLGAALAGPAPVGGVLASSAAVAVAVALVRLEEPSAAAAAAFTGLAVAIAVPFVVARPFRGYTGDVLGASVLLVETAALMIAGIL
ncbi:MAG: adenosylcobinamide-GDP ribazoletransferase [Coriobacteriia bacterium]|nr:adenosylcobinamide-GDP ribazoletransferase [Coriobacteriia bacterium]